ncbi:hypothetical protein [Amycolatopsis echigonensis]|uniref:hypothetical protein n=1 Tax=Amycolatopsis echigonensis TaxID=2576905 RepID=UPI000C70ADE4|nr:hypothetical protein [Amycolatopsis niigatensis]
MYAPAAYAKKQRLAETAMTRLGEAVRRGVKVALRTDSGVGISAGKTGDFAVCEGDPLADIEILGDPRAASSVPDGSLWCGKAARPSAS